MANTYYSRFVPEDQPSVAAAIADLLSNGFTTTDQADIIVASGSYLDVSGFTLLGDLNIAATIGSTLGGLNIITSGSLNITNFNVPTLGVSGEGTVGLIGVSGGSITISGSASVVISSGILGTVLNAIDCESFSAYNQFASGNAKLILHKIKNVNIISGNCSNFADTGFKYTFSLCSGVYVGNMMGANISGGLLDFKGCPDLKINHVTLASNVSGYTIAKFEPSGSINCSGTIDYSILVGNAGSGQGPIVVLGSQKITSSGCCLYNFVDNQSYTGVSGYYFNRDPLFVNASGGDLRPDVNSPCASAADSIDFIDLFGDVNVEQTTLSEKSIKFMLLNQGIKAVQPSGIYVVKGGSAVFFKSDPTLDNDMDVLLNKQYQVHASGQTFQSYTNGGVVTGFESDYKLIPYVDYESNEEKYVVHPFTILSFDDLINSVNGFLQDVAVSGLYQFNGFTRDRFQRMDGLPLYWVGEKYNGYLYGYDMLANAKADTYPLFLDTNFQSVQLTDINFLYRNEGQATVTTDKIFVDDHYEQRNISIDNANGIFKFRSFEKQPGMSVAALGTLSDWLVVLGREDVKDQNEDLHIRHHLYFYNKYDRDPFVTPVAAISGVAGLYDVNVGDITFNDLGNLLVSVSGSINVYKLLYDYALLTRTNGLLKSSLLFREDYEGVQI